MQNNQQIGGTKGHVEETVQDQIFIAVYNAFRWKMIPNCTGRYTCRDHKSVSHLAPREMLKACGIDKSPMESLVEYRVEFHESRRKDPIHVIPFANDQAIGLITYVKMREDGDMNYVHTLNSESGFQRKLEALDVVLTDDCIVSSCVD